MQITVLIRLSLAAQAVELAKPREDQPAWTNTIKTEYARTLDTDNSLERNQIAGALRQTQCTNADASLRVGNYVPSTITREPLLFPIAYDTLPSDEAIWNQLAIMAKQHADMINPSGMAF